MCANCSTYVRLRSTREDPMVNRTQCATSRVAPADKTIISKKSLGPRTLHRALVGIINCRDIREPPSELSSFVPDEIIRLRRVALDSATDISDCVARSSPPPTHPTITTTITTTPPPPSRAASSQNPPFCSCRYRKYRIADVKQYN